MKIDVLRELREARSRKNGVVWLECPSCRGEEMPGSCSRCPGARRVVPRWARGKGYAVA
jgi:hypothetical protein